MMPCSLATLASVKYGVELRRNLGERALVVFHVDAARHGQQALVRAQARADVVAQAELFAHVQKELGRDAADVERFEDKQRRDVRLLHTGTQPVAHGELSLRDRERLGHIARLGFQRVHADVGADVFVDLAARHR